MIRLEIFFLSIFCACLLAVTPVCGDELSNLRDVLMQCQDAYHRLADYRGVLRHEVGRGGGAIREDEIEVLFRKPSFLTFRWQTGLFKGTTLAARPSWNHGNLLIHLGEWFDFLTLSVPATEVGDPFVPGLKDLSEWLTALSMLAQRSMTDRSLRQVELHTEDPRLPEGQVLLVVPAFLVPFRDNNVASYEFFIEKGTGIPMELILRGVAGDVRERMAYRELQVNIGISTQDSEWEGLGDGSRILPRDEVALDMQKFIRNWQHRYLEVTDYTGEWVLEEYRGGSSFQSSMPFKFRKPFDVYFSWAKNERRGRGEALFRHGWNNERVRIRTTVAGIPLIGDLEPGEFFSRWGFTYSPTAFGFNHLVEALHERLLREWLRENLQVRFHGLQNCFGQACYAIEFRFPRNLENEGAPARLLTYWDISSRLPVRYEEFDWEDKLSARQEFRDLQLNVALRDLDFEAANASYGFLLFPSVPRLDRFLTGRE
ncbi:MAG: DUF1571 domain-containing protein [Deltaproteobacteria bacterium]|nr:DUF1571 domain-containing protein [Deltaproteobacteria bacterium]